METDSIGTESMICNSVTSDSGIGYGGVDAEGAKDPASRRHCRDVWDDEEEMEEYFE